MTALIIRINYFWYLDRYLHVSTCYQINERYRIFKLIKLKTKVIIFA
ncbi:hypothetical protein A1OE_1516 [Candidatus Endolissoclinum faulkneri L2]|uniref:Uncharacterized protein n=1 Tax=Candidatus Endolissoclinum faulkneri L2 TaxID=1193729 RepID=K7YJ62_9PROT|nr:hypothetical protein A1OE_1516 [Candidatus Endolissoclinum faulkneri L2]